MPAEQMEVGSVESPSATPTRRKGLSINPKVTLAFAAFLVTAAVASAVLAVSLNSKPHQTENTPTDAQAQHVQAAPLNVAAPSNIEPAQSLPKDLNVEKSWSTVLEKALENKAVSEENGVVSEEKSAENGVESEEKSAEVAKNEVEKSAEEGVESEVGLAEEKSEVVSEVRSAEKEVESEVRSAEKEVVEKSAEDGVVSEVRSAEKEVESEVRSAEEQSEVVSSEKRSIREGVTDIRLPTSIRPVHYELWLQPFIHGDLSILGSVRIEFEVLEPTNNITLHILDIITKNETVTVTPVDGLGGAIGITSQSFDLDRQFYIAQLDTMLEAKNYYIYMDYEGYLNDQLVGFYRSTYTDADGAETLLAVTQFEATDARRAFPCFDEPAMKATLDVNIAREESMSALSNMPIIKTESIPDQPGWVWDTFERTPKVSTYLVAFVVSDFLHRDDAVTNDHVIFRVWAREEAIDQTDYALSCGPQILTYYEDYFSVPFPLPKQDMIAIPDFSAGAMENWGLITYRETALLYVEGESSARNKERVAVVIAHELAHQWFGNLVTMKWWNDLWLNEGFASYVEVIGTNSIEPDWQMKDKFVSEDMQYVLELDSLESSHPISIPVENPDEINQIFDSISYSKGSSIIRMMNHFLSEDTFRQGITNYLNSLKYDNAAQDDLWQFLTDVAHTDGALTPDITVKMIMDTWTLQMGYPVITVTRSVDGTSATVTQQRFLSVKNETNADDGYSWWIPLTYTNQDAPDFDSTQPSMWMTDTDQQVTVTALPSSDKWVIFNIQETGYYRVNYDQDNWNLLIQQLSTNHTVIHVVNRAQIIDDALDLARAGDLDYPTALSVNTYLSNEDEYIPWNTAMDNLGYMEGMFTRKGGYGSFRSYLLSLLVPLYESVGFDDVETDPHLTHYKRTLASSWVCDLLYQDCVDQSVALYQNWMLNPDAGNISPNQKSTVYCTGIAEGGETEWDFAWNQYLTSNLGQEKDRLLSALGCSQEIWILSRYLEMAFTEDSGIRRQDASRVFSSIARNDVGRDLAWNFLRDQVAMISEYVGTFTTIGDMVLTVSSDFNTQEEKRQLEQFKADNLADLGTATLAIDQAIEKTENNIIWMDNYYQVILQWLQDQGYGK